MWLYLAHQLLIAQYLNLNTPLKEVNDISNKLLIAQYLNLNLEG